MTKHRNTLQTISILTLVAVMLILVGMIFLPYASVLLWAALIYILVNPLYNKILKRMNPNKRGYNIKKQLLAGTFAVMTVLILTGIMCFVVIKIFGQAKLLAQNIYTATEKLVKTTNENDIDIIETVYRLSLGTIDLSSMDLKRDFLSFISKYSENILSYTTSFAKNISSFFLSLIFLAFSLYFFYIDGDYLLGILKHAIPIDGDASSAIFGKIKEVTTNLFKGLFLVSFFQSVAAFIVYLTFGVESALLLAILTFFSSFMPLIGCGFVWLPIGIGFFFTASKAKAFLFMIIAGSIISFLDNFLRPLFLKDRIKIHPLLIFFSMLGGVKLFGFNGIILGPMAVILFFTILDIALESDVTENNEIKNQAENT